MSLSSERSTILHVSSLKPSSTSESYSEPSKTSKMELFTKIVKLFTVGQNEKLA